MENIIIDGQEYLYDKELDKLIISKYKNEELNNIKKEINENYNNIIDDNIDIDFWQDLLSRKLYKKENKIIYKVWLEKSLNSDIKDLQKNLIKLNCVIKEKTNNSGDCLFESLASFGLGENDSGIEPHIMIRNNVASILLSCKNEINFFPNINMTPNELFENINEIDIVRENDTNDIYIYDYDTMILDLNTDSSWERLPTEFIMMTISRIYKVKFLIYHNKTDYVNKINVWNEVISDDLIETIKLGQINEEHYFPVIEISDKLKNQLEINNELLNIYYDDNINEYKIWANLMLNSLTSNTNLNNETINNDKSIDEYINSDKNENNITNCKTIKKKLIKNDIESNIEKQDYIEISNMNDFFIFL